MANSPVMSDPVLHILLAVSDEPRHGYAIAQEVEERTGGAVRLGTGTLYSALKRLNEEGLIAEVREGSSSGRGKRTYGLTERGRHELGEQTRRLEALFRHAREKGPFLDPEPAS